MTTAISNVNAIWVDANAKVGLGFNAVDIGQNTSSRLIRLQANSNTVFDVTTNGIVNANAYIGNTVTSNIIYSVVYTVPNLPAASSVGSGARAFVSDCNNRTFYSRVFTGGSNAVPVFSNGTYWLVG
jgi:hypothetical protein